MYVCVCARAHASPASGKGKDTGKGSPPPPPVYREEGRGAARLMAPGDEDVLSWYRVDPKVNSNRASGPELIEPI